MHFSVAYDSCYASTLDLFPLLRASIMHSLKSVDCWWGWKGRSGVEGGPRAARKWAVSKCHHDCSRPRCWSRGWDQKCTDLWQRPLSITPHCHDLWPMVQHCNVGKQNLHKLFFWASYFWENDVYGNPYATESENVEEGISPEER